MKSAFLLTALRARQGAGDRRKNFVTKQAFLRRPTGSRVPHQNLRFGGLQLEVGQNPPLTGLGASCLSTPASFKDGDNEIDPR